jgi:hypothetical protein
MPDWIRVLVIFAIVYAILTAFRRRRRGIMHDRNALAKKFDTTPEDIIEVKRESE